MQQLSEKDKALWKGASRGSAQEQGLSASSVTLVSLQIGFVLVNERGKNKGENSALSAYVRSQNAAKTMFKQVMRTIYVFP